MLPMPYEQGQGGEYAGGGFDIGGRMTGEENVAKAGGEDESGPGGGCPIVKAARHRDDQNNAGEAKNRGGQPGGGLI